MRKEFKMIGVPISCGSPTIGSELASDEIKDNFSNIDYKKIKCPNKISYKNNELYSYTSVKKAVNKLYKEFKETMKEDKIPLVVGGDHSLSIGSVAASMEKYGDDLLVIWIDAHSDINTEKSSISHYIHGMTNAVNLGIATKKLSPIKNKYKLNGENLVILGARSIDDNEYPILRDNKVDYYDVETIRKEGTLKLLENKKVNNVHISFDVDCLDPKEFISTGYNLDNGFTIEEVKTIIKDLMSKYNLVSFECVEYNSLKDSNKQDLKKIVSIIEEVINY